MEIWVSASTCEGQAINTQKCLAQLIFSFKTSKSPGFVFKSSRLGAWVAQWRGSHYQMVMLSPLAQGQQKGQLGAEAQAKAAKWGWGRQSSDLRLNSPLDRESEGSSQREGHCL